MLTWYSILRWGKILDGKACKTIDKSKFLNNSMTKFINCTLLFTALILMSCNKGGHLAKTKKSVDVRVSTYNIRYESKADDLAGNGWEVRKKPVAELILKHGFDIVGTQEGNAKQLEELKGLLDGFDFIGYPYGGPDGKLHNCATYFKKSLFKVLDKGMFWLSETPGVPSKGWDATDTRICQWIKFKEVKSGKEFYFFNAHFYFRAVEARKNSGALMVSKIREIAKDAPVVFVGDLNSTPEMTQIGTIKSLLNDCAAVSKTPREGFEKTFPGGRFSGNPEMLLDYMFVSDHFNVLDYKVLADTYNDNRYPSDHLPITSKLELIR
jgi:endonuclease/exonuclease/phosphatase family metal-dependent hydrolase